MNIIVSKSMSVGDIFYAHSIGNWQFGSNGISGPIGYKTPVGSLLVIKCSENGRWYVMGLTSGNPHKIPQGEAEIHWPSFDDMAKEKDYVAQVKFYPRIGGLKIYTEEEIEDIIDEDLGKYKIGGVFETSDAVAGNLTS